MARPKKQQETEAQDVQSAKPKGNDGIMTVTMDTAEGSVTRTFRVAGFLGNTLPWQRSGKALDDMLIPGLLRAFGGQVTPE